MGITYKELVLNHTGKIKKSPIGGVFGCPGGYMPGLPDILHNCRAIENITSTFFCESCEQCWNTEVPFSLISNYIQEEEMKKEFTKADLKDGMMVVERNGYGYIWLYGAKRDDCECFHDTRNDLTSIRGRKHDIIKVGYPKVDSYDLTGVERILCSVNSGFRQIIWEREEKEISSEEAFAILKQHYGCDVKIKEK